MPNWLKDAKDLANNRAKLDWVKVTIKTSSIIYSKKLEQGCQKAEVELNCKYQDVLNKFQESSSKIPRQKIDKLKNELETLREEQVELLFIQEQDGTSTVKRAVKFFLNLEKHNIKKRK